jgi:hypothetical protein
VPSGRGSIRERCEDVDVLAAKRGVDEPVRSGVDARDRLVTDLVRAGFPQVTIEKGVDGRVVRSALGIDLASFGLRAIEAQYSSTSAGAQVSPNARMRSGIAATSSIVVGCSSVSCRLVTPSTSVRATMARPSPPALRVSHLYRAGRDRRPGRGRDRSPGASSLDGRRCQCSNRETAFRDSKHRRRSDHLGDCAPGPDHSPVGSTNSAPSSSPRIDSLSVSPSVTV